MKRLDAKGIRGFLIGIKEQIQGSHVLDNSVRPTEVCELSRLPCSAALFRHVVEFHPTQMP